MAGKRNKRSQSLPTVPNKRVKLADDEQSEDEQPIFIGKQVAVAESVSLKTEKKYFGFMDLPQDIRYMVYEILLTNNRDPRDRVLRGNNLETRVKERNRAIKEITCTPCLEAILARKDTPHDADGEKHDLKYLDSSARWTSRYRKPIFDKFIENHWSPINEYSEIEPLCPRTPLLSTAIMSVCKAVYREAEHILYTKNTFHATYATSSNTTPADNCPFSWDWDLIRRLRLEIQIVLIANHRPDDAKEEDYHQPFQDISGHYPWRFIMRMKNLRFLQIYVTFNRPRIEELNHLNGHGLNYVVAAFSAEWRITAMYRRFFRSIIAAVPKNVELTWGMTKRQKETGDWHGSERAKNSVLRAINNYFLDSRGEDCHRYWGPLVMPVTYGGRLYMNTRPDRQLVYPVDDFGGGEDSDVEKEEE